MIFEKKEKYILTNKELNKLLSSDYRLSFGDLIDSDGNFTISIKNDDKECLLNKLNIDDKKAKIRIFPSGNSYLFNSNNPFKIIIEFNVEEVSIDI